MLLYCSLNTRCKYRAKVGVMAAKTVSTKCTFNKILDEKLLELKTKMIKKKHLAKM